ncbi:hypothetical protein PLICRDRAFT_98881 [Plicaturopsis crispa FD-325 SS-3]|nr:hypothetical protein PLICRDRAFT_98881 [Plicaturopsis crispa FD-325 SS-3]
MPLNVPGILVPFHLLINPRLVLPALTVKDIRQIDFSALRRAGYRGAVFDKDNCLTLPHKDTLVPELQDAWRECRETFGAGNVIIVSNSAGTKEDAGDIQAESVTHHLAAPVLRHATPKPGYKCISSIRAYFASRRDPVRDEELVIVGDRIFTDIVMANRMARRKHCDAPVSPNEQTRLLGDGPLAIWTDGVWKRESMGMRFLERRLVMGVERWIGRLADAGATQRFVKQAEKEEVKADGYLRRVFRTWRN